jgi:hypothetical protein
MRTGRPIAGQSGYGRWGALTTLPDLASAVAVGIWGQYGDTSLHPKSECNQKLKELQVTLLGLLNGKRLLYQ